MKHMIALSSQFSAQLSNVLSSAVLGTASADTTTPNSASETMTRYMFAGFACIIGGLACIAVALRSTIH